MKNIYKIGKELFITSNEEIKHNDYITDGYRVWKWEDDSSLLGRKKVIMTTDKDLIAEGVQEIDDDFINWFVNNRSCEYVETELVHDYEEHPELVGNPKEKWSYYEIIIPQSEPNKKK